MSNHPKLPEGSIRRVTCGCGCGRWQYQDRKRGRLRRFLAVECFLKWRRMGRDRPRVCEICERVILTKYPGHGPQRMCLACQSIELGGMLS